MKFKAPDNCHAVALHGMTFTPFDGNVEITNIQSASDLDALASFGLVRVADVPAEVAPAPDDADEKRRIIADLAARGVKADGRKTLASLKAMLESTSSPEAQ